MPAFTLSPSRIARFYYHECERYLRWHCTAKADRISVGVPEIREESSPVTRAVLEGGYRWEEEVIQNHIKETVRIAKGKSQLHKRAFGVTESISTLKNLKIGESVYQPALEVPQCFYERYGLNSDFCHFPPCRPDLIQLTQNKKREPCLRIIDIKAADVLKTSHRIQISLYALILRDIAETHQIPYHTDTDTAAVWLSGREEPENFELCFSIRILEQFLRHDLVSILEMDAQEVPWHLFHRCEWCEFYTYCRKEAEEKQSVSLIPGLSARGRRFLRELNPPVNTLDEFEAFLQKESADQHLESCGSLRGKRKKLQNAVTALKQGKVIAHVGSSLALPVSEDVNITLTLQAEPLSGKIYAAGFRRLKGKEVYGSGSEEKIFIAQSPDDCGEIQTAFLHALHEELKTLDAYNRNREKTEQKSLQIYTFDTYEKRLFHRLLQESLKMPDRDSASLQMIFCFQDKSPADKDQHPATELSFQPVVLTSVIRKLLALPLPISLRLPETLALLPSPHFDFRFDPSPMFWFELGSTMKSDAIFNVWHGGKSEQSEWIENEIRRRLTGAQAVTDGIRAKVSDQLFAWPRKFLFPEMQNFRNSEISRLAFIIPYESFTAARNMREARTAPISERISKGISILLEYAGHQQWKVLSEIQGDALNQNGFPHYLLTPDTEEGERAQMAFDDFLYRKTMYAPKGEVRLAAIREMKTDAKTQMAESLHLDLRTHRDQTDFRKGDKALLHSRFTDFTLDNMLTRLSELDEEPDNDFLKLLRNPAAFASEIRMEKKADFIKTAEKYAGFTPSQMYAFRHFLENRLTLVWGPPGTGKTHFLAKALLCFVKICKEMNQGLRIAVTAFTHAAIENLLEDIRQHMKNFALEHDLFLCKMKNRSSPKGENLPVIPDSKLYDAMEHDLLIAGGTVHSFHKSGVEHEFPILIADEASQMKFGEFALAMKLLEKNGRIMLAGDDLQLPPIISGEYPESEDGLPGLHDSVFAYLRARDKSENPYTSQLQENWRMNAVLSHFPAMTLYGRDYRPATKQIAGQKICLKPENSGKSDENTFCQWLLNPDYPLILCVPENTQTAVENQTEARLAALLAHYLRNRLIRENTEKTYPDTEAGDKAFWSEGLFIVSPHHAQIRAIRKEMAALREWKSLPFVDTVDKMQGQQCENVIVSYGVSDAETALSEAEFIYSLNRLNVSVTRAKAKCIVFISRPLLEPCFDLLQNEAAVKGLGYMLALADFCTRFGEEKDFDLCFAGSRGKVKTFRAETKKW
ncbi:MAG: AAA domain-containing protein [Desulfococcaceae bacterium]